MKKAAGIITGMAVVGAVGAATYMVKSKTMKSTRKNIVKNASRAAKNVSNFLDGVSVMLK